MSLSAFYRASALLAVTAFAVAGCATFGGGGSEPAPANTPQSADALPSLGSVQDIDSAPVQRPITGTCGMEHLQHFVGRPRLTVDRRSLPPNYRVLGPDSITTMEYQGDRLTIRIDREDRIESLTCG